MLYIYENDRNLCIWACECRNSNDIMIVLGTEQDKNINNLFNDNLLRNAKYFNCEDYNSAVNFVYKQIKYLFKDKMVIEKHYKFDLYRSIDALRRIKDDASMLDYENYNKLATFYDDVTKYSCDLIIDKGQMGLQYNSHNKDNLENLKFEPCNINLENEVTLMLNMQNKLNTFIDNELEYSIEMNTNIKI